MLALRLQSYAVVSLFLLCALQVLRRTAALSEDMGYECGLQSAAQVGAASVARLGNEC